MQERYKEQIWKNKGKTSKRQRVIGHSLGRLRAGSENLSTANSIGCWSNREFSPCGTPFELFTLSWWQKIL